MANTNNSTTAAFLNTQSICNKKRVAQQYIYPISINKNSGTSVISAKSIRTNAKYLGFSSAQEMIYRLLTHDRIVLLPTVVPKVSELELSEKLNITPKQLKSLRRSPMFYNKMVKYINLPLINLYCSTVLQELDSLPLYTP